ncbi:MAG: 4Fe-4S binding protein [Pseudomonadota bacterium]
MVNVNEAKCVGCGSCMPYCPVEALWAWGKAEVNDDCTECLVCIDYCPVDALEVSDG